MMTRSKILAAVARLFALAKKEEKLSSAVHVFWTAKVLLNKTEEAQRLY